MNRIKGFSLGRFLLLIRNDLFLNRSFFLISSAAVGGIIFIRSSLNIIGHNNHNPMLYMNFYALVLTICGVIVTLKLFHDMQDEVKSISLFTLPASPLEKFASRLILSTILFTAGVIILFFLVSLISEGLNRLITGSSHLLFNPFGQKVFIASIKYFTFQAPFLLGAVYFKKNPFIKTVLSLVIYFFILSIFFIIFLKIFFAVVFGNFTLDGIILALLNEDVKLTQIWTIFKRAIHIAFWYVLPPLCWVIGYFRIKEKEV